VATTLNNIGTVFWNKRDYENALVNYNKSLQIRKRVLGPDSIQVATTLNNIGLFYDKNCDYEKALENYNKCLEIYS
jgi:tetratricopeptide (TPR) repeat protein